MDRAHAGPIWRLGWGHPEFGEPLASCSEDCSVKIWYGGRSVAGARTSNEAAKSLPQWPSRANLAFEGPVVDLRFAPITFGLKLAGCTADGKARVHECANTLDLRTWDHEDLEVVAHKLGNASTSAALDWMPAPFGGAAVNAEDRGEILAVGGRSGKLAIWGKDKNGRWKELRSAEAQQAHRLDEGGIKDVAWCPNICRNYEIVATCGAGAKLWRITFKAQDGTPACDIALLLDLSPTASPPDGAAHLMWRCSWNLMGTTLALCGEAGKVSVWKADASNQWREEVEVGLHAP